MRINRTDKLAELITSFDPTDDFESSLIGGKWKKCLFDGKFTTFLFEISNLRDLRQGFFLMTNGATVVDKISNRG